jgi:hypothetical protein
MVLTKGEKMKRVDFINKYDTLVKEVDELLSVSGNDRLNAIIYKKLSDFANFVIEGVFDKKTGSERVVFKKPTLEEVKSYCAERKNNVDPEKLFNYYESNGWRVGKNPMKDWKASVRVWERKNKPKEEEPTVLVEEGSFYIDESMTEYLDLLSGYPGADHIAFAVWQWIFKNFEGRRVKISFIRSMIEKFKKGGI